MRIAVVGTGVSGLVAARLLCAEHEVAVFEADDRIGGHVNTVDVEAGGERRAIDTGFIVFNERTYPGLVALFRALGVAWKPTEMSFSVRCERTGLEYGGADLDALFAQRRNVLRPAFWRMVRDLLRFYREAPRLLEDGGEGPTLGEYLRRERYSSEFIEWHLVPMAAAVWSARPAGLSEFPAAYLVRFFANHGFLQVEGRPAWLVVEGGSRSYLEPLVRPFRGAVRTGTPVAAVRRVPGGVEVETAPGERARFDRVVLAVHAPRALRMLADASDAERAVLSAFAYQPNEAVLHTDASLLPRRAKVRSSWNYVLPRVPEERATVTYWMNRLQGLPEGPPALCVTLNSARSIDPARVLRRIDYEHPVYTPAAVRAQGRHAEIDGVRGVHFCGAYWGYGFHEDGLQSALRVGRSFGLGLESIRAAAPREGHPAKVGA